ncbi:hypothetical protein [[Eubacterium] cellulosolvens]
MCKFDGGDRTDHHMLLDLPNLSKAKTLTPKDTRRKIIFLILKSNTLTMNELKDSFHIVIQKDPSNKEFWKV